jgi:hypothetical protein
VVSIGATSVIRRKPPGHQEVVVCKIQAAAVCAAEVLPRPRLAPALSCCLQDSVARHPGARPLQQNALGRKLSCCLQDRTDAVFGPERAAAADCALRRLGVAPDTAANNPSCGIAISVGYPGIPGGIPGPPQSFRDDIQRDAGADSRGRCTPPAPAETLRAERSAHNTGIAVRPYRRLSHPAGRDCQVDQSGTIP